MRKFSKKEKSEWPDQHRACTKCECVKPFSDFHAHKGCLYGVNTVCRDCRGVKTRQTWRVNKSDPDYLIVSMLRGAAERAKKYGREFALTREDITVPDRCPVFDTPLVWGSPDPKSKPSLDRIDSSQGYVPGNVAVISWRANTLKNNGTAEELRAIADWIDLV